MSSLPLFVKQGVEAEFFSISFKRNAYFIQIGDFRHSYPYLMNDKPFNLEAMIEDTLVHFLKHKGCNEVCNHK